MSADGRFIAFQSWATNLVPADTNNAWDIFVHDRTTGDTTRVSVASNGDQANGSSYSPSISADGQYVAFHSDATNLIDDDNNGHSDVFVRDLQTGTTAIVSLTQDGSPANGDSKDPAISGDGRYVAFTSDASNLVNNDPNGVADVFVHDVASGHTVLASAGNAQDPGVRGSSGASISDDGRYTVYSSQTTTLGLSLDLPEIYVYDMIDGSDTMVSVNNDGAPSGGSTYRPSISGSGEYVVFDSGDTANLVSGMTGGIFLRNLRTNITSAATASGLAAVPNGDGRYVVFAASRQYLSPDDPTGAIDVYRLDRQTGTTIRVSQNDSGEPGNGESGTYDLGASGHATSVSESGQVVAFTSIADNLVPNDTNNDWDVFVRDLGQATPERGPSVPSFTSLTPSPYSTVSPGQTTIGATVEADSPPSEVVLLVDDQPIAPVNVASGGPNFQVTAVANLTAGVHTLTVIAFDADGDKFQAQWDVIAGNPGDSEWFLADGELRTDQFNATMRSLVEAFRWHLYGQSWDGANHPELPTHVGLAGTGAPLESWANGGTIDQASTTATLRSLVEAFRWHFWGISWDGNTHPEVPTHSSDVLPPQPIDSWFTADGQPIPENINVTLRSLVESFRLHFWGYSWDGQHHPEIPTHAK
ncbi:MAG: hypothetical protein WBW04_10625 [Nitrolancea sp.]